MKNISVVIITKNNEEVIERCLESAKNFSEIILVDEYSTDKTEEISKKFNTKIIKQKWLGFAKQKNLGIKNTRNDWVLSLDSDESLSKELLNEIKNLDPNNFDGFYLKRRTKFLGHYITHAGWYPDYQIRLFKKSKMMFEDRDVHEKVLPNGNIGKLKNDILHESYKNIEEYLEKFNKYTTLDAGSKRYKNYKISFKFYLLILFKPIYKFLKMYLWQLGFLDGFIGYLLCKYSAYYEFSVLAKVYMDKKCKN